MNAFAALFRRASIAGAVLVALSAPATAQMALPDAEATCVVPPATFDAWFDSGAPTAGGTVANANSLDFSPTSLCDFLLWGQQMFLWLTSPAGDGLVVDGPDFFTVTPIDANGERHLIPSTEATATTALRARKGDEIGELGQAGGGGVLMSQGKSLVYYGIHVNDVYAYFVSGQKDGNLPDATAYPHNDADVKALQAYMASAFPGVELEGADTLALEIKTSWVDASTVPDASAYVTLEAYVPTYTADAANTTWTPTGDSETMTLALIGMHVVGTVRNHPEFVWATFEHVSNAPNAPYWYKDADGKWTRQPYDTSGDYLFLPSGADPSGANVACMKEDGDDRIVAHTDASGAPVCDGGIVPSATVRTFPWGNPSEGQSDLIVDLNTDMLSSNNSVISQLAAGDVRANYVQVGSVWTSAGGDDVALVPMQDKDFSFFDLRGTPTLSNATMETYHQGSTCFDCHQIAEGATGTDAFKLSHIFSRIVSLAGN